MSTVTTYAVTGMTCSHCVAAVTEEVGRLDGVTAVTVDLHPEGHSAVVVTSDRPLLQGAVRGAIDEAGYCLVEAA
jgi:copper ion binding protein